MPHPTSSANTTRIRPQPPGFTLLEVVIALAIFAVVISGILVLLANSMRTRAEVRRDTIAVMICQQMQQALDGYRLGIDDTQAAAPGGPAGLLDEFLPFSFAKFPAAGTRMVVGFDSGGAKRGKKCAEDYDAGTTQDGVDYFATIEGAPVKDSPGLTEVVIGVEHPAGDPAPIRKRREFRVWMSPRETGDTADKEAMP